MSHEVASRCWRCESAEALERFEPAVVYAAGRRGRGFACGPPQARCRELKKTTLGNTVG